MEYFILIGALILVLVTGLMQIKRAGDALYHDYKFVQDFKNKFVQFVTPYLQQPPSVFAQPSLDWELYNGLVSNMDKTQELLGTFGVALYSAAFNRFQIPNYPYIINTIPQIRTGQAHREDILMCDDMMARYIGAMTRYLQDEERKIRKPFMWLQTGLQFYIGLPIRMLYWFGIIGASSLRRITASKFFKVFSGISGFVAFIASLIRVLQAWPFIRSLFIK